MAASTASVMPRSSSSDRRGGREPEEDGPPAEMAVAPEGPVLTLLTRGRGAPDVDGVGLITGAAPDDTSPGTLAELDLGTAPGITRRTGVVTVLLRAGVGIPAWLTLVVPADGPAEELGEDIIPPTTDQNSKRE